MCQACVRLRDVVDPDADTAPPEMSGTTLLQQALHIYVQQPWGSRGQGPHSLARA